MFKSSPSYIINRHNLAFFKHEPWAWLVPTRLWHRVSSAWAFAEPLFVFWLDIIYNERWLVNLFKWLCYFSPRHAAIRPPEPSPSTSHTPTLVTFLRGVWATVTEPKWSGGQVQLLSKMHLLLLPSSQQESCILCVFYHLYIVSFSVSLSFHILPFPLLF